LTLVICVKMMKISDVLKPSGLWVKQQFPPECRQCLPFWQYCTQMTLKVSVDHHEISGLNVVCCHGVSIPDWEVTFLSCKNLLLVFIIHAINGVKCVCIKKFITCKLNSSSALIKHCWYKILMLEQKAVYHLLCLTCINTCCFYPHFLNLYCISQSYLSVIGVSWKILLNTHKSMQIIMQQETLWTFTCI
jgi:hypothetical protein